MRLIKIGDERARAGTQEHLCTHRTFQVKCVLELPPPLVLFCDERIEARWWRAESEMLDNTTLFYFSGKEASYFTQ